MAVFARVRRRQLAALIEKCIRMISTLVVRARSTSKPVGHVNQEFFQRRQHGAHVRETSSCTFDRTTAAFLGIGWIVDLATADAVLHSVLHGEALVGMLSGFFLSHFQKHLRSIVDRLGHVAEFASVKNQRFDDVAHVRRALFGHDACLAVHRRSHDARPDADGEILRVHLVLAFAQGDLVKESQDVDERVQVFVGQEKENVEVHVHLLLGRQRTHGETIEQEILQRMRDQRVGQTTEEFFEQRADVEDGVRRRQAGRQRTLFDARLEREW